MRYKKTLIVSLTLLMMASLTVISLVNAAPTPKFPYLPSGTVNLTTDFFIAPNIFDIISILTNVPPGYDVHDGAYTGWCVDRRGLARPTNDLVYLYSSINLPPIPQLKQQDWHRINYILNNVAPGATSLDIQEAIWTFSSLGGKFTPTRLLALAMVSDANANGAKFVPARGQIAAVICFPIGWLTENLQITIIEVMVSTSATGKVTGGGQCITGLSSEIPAASFGFNAMWFSRDPAPKGELNYIDHITGMHVHIHAMTYLEVSVDEPGNKPMPLRIAIFGGPCRINGVEGFFADVYVEDHGEPGVDDMFKITLSTDYVGGSDAVTILAGNIQIHKPPT